MNARRAYTDHILIDFKIKANRKLTMTQVMAKVAEYKQMYPQDEIFMSGEHYAITRRVWA